MGPSVLQMYISIYMLILKDLSLVIQFNEVHQHMMHTLV